MKKYDLSIHFTLKGQTVEQIDQKLNNWLDSDKYQGQFDFSENDEDEPRNVLHHCFLPKEKVIARQIGTEVWDFLDTISEHIICWNGVWNDGDSLCWDRRLMLENIQKVNGISIFIGDIIEGVKEEYDIAVELGIDCILIP
jgi:hypothetical protein